MSLTFPMLTRTKALLMYSLDTDAVTSILEPHYITQIKTLLRNKIFIHEHLYARCFFLHVFAFDAYTNTCHEGTNRGIKYSEKRVMPNMSQTESTKMLTLQDADRNEAKAKKVSDAFHKTALHSSTPTVNHIQKHQESMLQDELGQLENYISVQVSSNKWHVLYSASRNVPKGIKPVYKRVREVTRTESGHLHCSCGYASQFGIPDRHISHVATHYGLDFQGWTPADVALRHHNVYCHLVASKLPAELTDEEKQIRRKMVQIQDLNQPILPFAPALRDNEEGSSKFAIGKNCTNQADWSWSQVQSTIDKVRNARHPSALNYTAADIEKVLQAEGTRENAAGLTQSQHLCHDEDSDGTSVAFDIDFSAVSTSSKKSAYAESAPVLKELGQTLESLSQDERRKALNKLDLFMNDLKRSISDRQGGAPEGRTVSAKLQRPNPESRHEKQK